MKDVSHFWLGLIQLCILLKPAQAAFQSVRKISPRMGKAHYTSQLNLQKSNGGIPQFRVQFFKICRDALVQTYFPSLKVVWFESICRMQPLPQTLFADSVQYGKRLPEIWAQWHIAAYIMVQNGISIFWGKVGVTWHCAKAEICVGWMKSTLAVGSIPKPNPT